MKKNKMFFTVGISFLLALAAFAIVYSPDTKQEESKLKDKPLVKQQSVTKPKNSLGDDIVAYGMGFLGTPYVVAGCSKDGFDCSGFVYFVFKHFEINVPRSSSEFEHFGLEISVENVRKGDILLFLSPTRDAIGHIGIVSTPKGGDSDFIHASSGREMKVIISSLATKGYTRRLVKAIRVL